MEPIPRKDLEAKKRHHYVWANYLARWGNGTKNVFYTTKNGRFACDSVRAIVVENLFYKITTLTGKHVQVIESFARKSPEHLHHQHMSYLQSFLLMQQAEASYRQSGVPTQEIELYLHAVKCNALENIHAHHEEMVLPVLAALADEQLDVLQDQQLLIKFMAFLGQQIFRTKNFRDGTIRALSRRNAMEIEVANAMTHAWWFLSYMFGMNLGFSLYTDRHCARHALLINDTTVPFITSDQPVVNVHSCVSDEKFAVPMHADFYYPISPRVAYIICDSERFTPGKNKIDERTAAELNSRVAARAMVHIIGDTEDAIRPFKRYIGRCFQKIPNSHL